MFAVRNNIRVRPCR